jgi:glycosyltransferase involved in cell wall biosynthesis
VETVAVRQPGHKTVLMIDYYFPPLAGAGVHRTLGYLRHLEEFGWTPIVLTARSGEHNFYDPSLLQWIPAGLQIKRTRSIEPVRFSRQVLAGASRNRSSGSNYTGVSPEKSLARLARLGSWILFPDRHIGWLPFAVWTATRLRRSSIDMIYSTSTAVTSHLIAYALKTLWRKPWIADFQDPWTAEYDFNFPSPLHRRAALALERLIVRHADRVTVTTKPMKEIFRRKYPAVAHEKFQVIHMGFDPETLTGIQETTRQKFTVTHFGTFYGTRSPGPFLHALGTSVQREPALKDTTQVRFFGAFEPRMRTLAEDLIKAYALNTVVELLPLVAYRDGMQQLMNSDVLLLVTDPGGCGRDLIPSKIFEYFGVGRPILALTPEGAVAELVREAQAGVVVRPDDVDAIRDAIVALHGQWRRGTLVRPGNQEFIATCSWQARTAQLAAALDSVVGSEAGMAELAQSEGTP